MKQTKSRIAAVQSETTVAKTREGERRRPRRDCDELQLQAEIGRIQESTKNSGRHRILKRGNGRSGVKFPAGFIG